MLSTEMQLNSVTSRHRAALARGAAASLALWAAMALPAPPSAQAQDAQEAPPLAGPSPSMPMPPGADSAPDAPPDAVGADAGAPERGDPPTKRERLDQLFAALAALGAEEEAERKRLAGEIGRLWSHSGSDSMDLLLRRGREALKAGEHKRALQHFSALTDHAPEFAEGWNARATTWFLLEEWGMALADIERTLELEPRHYGALTGLAVILERIDRPEDALRAWRQALAVHPHLERAVKAVERLSVEVEGRGI